MNWLVTPIEFKRDMMYSLMRLLMTPMPSSVAFFWALKAVASSLKYLTRVPGSGPSYRILALPS